MTQKTYFLVSGLIFLLVGVLHLVRLLKGWPVVIDNFAVPVWISIVGVLVAGYLAYYALMQKK